MTIEPASAFVPAWLAFARTLKGVAEVPGPKSNPTILGWAKGLGSKILGIVYGNDDEPWCGLFVAWCMNSAGIRPAAIAVRAKSWATWGQGCLPGSGAVLVFGRKGGGHVGFYEGEREDAYLVLGGNQGNRVCTTWIAKDRLLTSRWPIGMAIKGDRVMLAADGSSLSRNEV